MIFTFSAGADVALNDLIATGNFGNDVVANCS
jgi:hypothetical protein